MANTVLAPKPVQTPPKLDRLAPARKEFDLYGWLVDPAKFSPVVFFAGIALAFALCSLAGYEMSKKNIYENFHRFHSYINPSSCFYPTISQMVSLVEKKSNPEQTIVIVGGNSIFYGFGQNAGALWTIELQKLLGSKYAVFNLAMPSSDPFEGAYWTAEALLKKHRKVIYVTVARAAVTGFPEGSDTYGYAYWDAHEKHLLFHDKKRDEIVEQRVLGHSAQKRQKFADLRLRMQMDSLFYFEDLWTAISYANFSTVWTSLTANHPLSPRREYSDEQYSLVPLELRVQSAFLKTLKSDYSRCFVGATDKPSDSFFASMASTASNLVPQPVKQNCLMVVATPMPLFLSMLEKVDRSREEQAAVSSEDAWKKAGYNTINFTDRLKDEDYSDGIHLAPTGGRKVAALVAENVRSVTRNLGYNSQ